MHAKNPNLSTFYPEFQHGSMLGPFINYLPIFLDIVSSILHADDTRLSDLKLALNDHFKNIIK